MQPIETQSYSLVHLIGIIYRWRKPIAGLVITASVLTAVVSLFVPDYYTAIATFAPANEEKELFNLSGNNKNNSLYGDEDAVDRALLFAESAPLVDFMVKEFKLAERYAIDISTPKGEDRVVRRFRKLYNVKKNEHSGIEISVQDTDPQQAAKMLEKALQRIEQLYKDATRPNKGLLTQTYEAALQDKRQEVRQIMDTLMTLRRKYQVYDPEQQAKALSNVLVDAASQLAADRAQLGVYQQSGRGDSITVVTARIRANERRLALLQGGEGGDISGLDGRAFNEAADQIIFFQELLENINKDVADISAQYAQFKAQSNSTAGAIILLEPVQVPKVKSYPSRSLFVIGAAVLSLLLGLVGAVLLELYKGIDWQEVLQDDENKQKSPRA